jgi:hypothetical protein
MKWLSPRAAKNEASAALDKKVTIAVISPMPTASNIISDYAYHHIETLLEMRDRAILPKCHPRPG